MKLGSHYRRGGCGFYVWAPAASGISLRIVSPRHSVHPLEPSGKGYWKINLPDIPPGTRYFYEIGGERLPDPASHYQPDGVYGPSEVIDHSAFKWSDGAWHGFRQDHCLIYELHTGTFTPEGTFSAIIPRLAELRDLGVTAIELMPVAQFSGSRNWGYDGTFLFSVQNSYGGPRGLKELVDACHARGLCVILDVVYNHLGPEGNVLSRFGPYFTGRCQTPWGMGMNFDGPDSDEVRNFVTRNADHWFVNYHIDCLRLDAVQHIYDTSARPILRELAERARSLSRLLERRCALIAESDQDDSRLVERPEKGGYGLDAQWLDDFHHCVHALLTNEVTGYYADYGLVSQLAKTLEQGFVFTWTYSPSRRKHYGSSSRGIPPSRFIVFNQNHDQIGNRLFGERLSTLVPFEALKLAAGVMFAAPQVPMLFMGEEYAEEAPFLYFVDHSDEQLVRAVAEGRKNEFRSFVWQEEPPEPQAMSTFERSKLRWEKRSEGTHRTLREFYRTLARMKSRLESCPHDDRRPRTLALDEASRCLVFGTRRARDSTVFCANFGARQAEISFDNPCSLPLTRVIDSADGAWAGPGVTTPERIGRGRVTARLQPHDFAVYSNEL